MSEDIKSEPTTDPLAEFQMAHGDAIATVLKQTREVCKTAQAIELGALLNDAYAAGARSKGKVESKKVLPEG